MSETQQSDQTQQAELQRVKLEDLLKAGAHFGHLTSRWNPKMKPYIFMQRNGIHIIDLTQTRELLEKAADAAARFSRRGKPVLFTGTKKQARESIRKHAKSCESPYVVERWLGGTLTNFQTIRQSIRRMEDLVKMEQDGTMEQVKKKERLMKERKREKLQKVLSGIANMARLPGALFIVDIRREHIAVKEARKLGIPIIAIVDTNCDPGLVDYPIPANDDALKSIDYITSVIAGAIAEGSKERELQEAEAKAEKARRQQEIAAEKAKRKKESEARKAKEKADAAEKAAAEKAAAEKPETAPASVEAGEPVAKESKKTKESEKA